MPENLEAVALFTACSTQWRYAFSGARTGLDYPGIESMIRLLDFEPEPDTFPKLQILEHAIITVDRENHAKQDRRT